MAEQNRTQGEREEVPPRQDQLPDDIKEWTKDHVRNWILKEKILDSEDVDILYVEKICGASLLTLDKSDLIGLGFKLGPAKLILQHRDELVQQKKELLDSPARPCKPYPFNQFHYAYTYKENDILDVTESGALNLIEPCHEFKAYTNLDQTSTEDKMCKFTEEVIRFGAACMNSRTNGTIHFGVGDLPNYPRHGQILGATVLDKEAFVNALHCAIEGHFEHKQFQVARKCIKPPRFVQVFNPDMTSSDKYVIEVDIVPSYGICQDNVYYVFNMDRKKGKKKNKQKGQDQGEEKKFFYIRDGSSSKNLLGQTKPSKEHERFVQSINKLSQLRKEEEEKHLSDVKSSVQGLRLKEMITGGSSSMDMSHFERYILVTNQSHDQQQESLEFLLHLNPTAVLDFDPESGKNGLFKYFDKQEKVNVHFPRQYKITEAVETMASKLKLTKQMSWVFCNGWKGPKIQGMDKEEIPSDPDAWLEEKGASVRDVISFLCRKDILPHKRFLVIFLILSPVNNKMDPLLETFSILRQELGGIEQMLCLCENETVFASWKDLIDKRYAVDISTRAIFQLSLAEINGTVLSLWSVNHRSCRFLPSGNDKTVLLTKKVEADLDTLGVLCVNQCKEGTVNKQEIEEHFYKGGKVSWWNFYFSEQPGSMSFIKRDKYDIIMNVIIPELRQRRQACVSFSLLHLPGCGGTTLAMHVLWSLKNSLRCAVLKDGSSDLALVASQVVQLLIYEAEEQSSRIPVLLMVDDFEEMDDVYNLKQCIDMEIAKKGLSSKNAQVILFNCMRTELMDNIESTENTAFIDINLSNNEQKLFEEKLMEIERIFEERSETFYGFMVMKKNFLPKYIQDIAHNTLKNFSIEHKHTKLLAVLFLLNRYCKGSVLSVSLCEEFLEQKTPYCGSYKTGDTFGKFSTLVTRCSGKGEIDYHAVMAIHPKVAESCLQELADSHNITKADITNLLLTEKKFFAPVQGKYKLRKDVRSMLVKRYQVSEGESNRFSPLIQDIAKERPGAEETVLSNAVKCFNKDAIMFQLLARYHYLEKKNFKLAKDLAQNAKLLNEKSSYISDTSAQVIKHELKFELTGDRSRQNSITPEKLCKCLNLAHSATHAFRETQKIAREETNLRSQQKFYGSPYNTAGHIGEIEVGVLILEIVKKIPGFNQLNLDQYNNLENFLTGSMKLRCSADYCIVLKDFRDILCSLQKTMKFQFDFMYCFFVNLKSKKDIKESWTREKLDRFFCSYANVFSNSTEQLNDMSSRSITYLDICKAQQFLMRNKADTHSGILDFLSSGITGDKVEAIVERYRFIVRHSASGSDTVCQRINFIYANIVLYCIKPESRQIDQYSVLQKTLTGVLKEGISFKDNSAVYFIAVALLWPAQSIVPELSNNLGSYISQLSNSFWNELGTVSYGKFPVVHFYLGKKQGYDRLVSQETLRRNVRSEESIDSLLENGKLWEQEPVKQCLLRVTGQVQKNVILVDTIKSGLKIEVSPFYRSQLSGEWNKKVSFFLGFSMKGPLAFDIQFL